VCIAEECHSWAEDRATVSARPLLTKPLLGLRLFLRCRRDRAKVVLILMPEQAVAVPTKKVRREKANRTHFGRKFMSLKI